MTATPAARVQIDAFGLTDIGKKREQNEDQFAIVSLRKAAEVRQTSLVDQAIFEGLEGPEGLLLVVADGVGGQPKGEVASETAITTLVRYMIRIAGCFHDLSTDQEHEFLEHLEAGVVEAHRRITQELGSPAPGRRSGGGGPATTLTMAMLVWPRAYLVHAGDSRAFYLRKGRLLQLTRDQTMGEYMVDAGVWTEEQARRAPQGGSLVSAVGGGEMTPAVGLVDLRPGDWLLLCSDGLTRHVSNDEIAAILGKAPDAAAACRALVDAALAGGGHDNITVIAARTGA